jgi:hypothetical protein
MLVLLMEEIYELQRCDGAGCRAFTASFIKTDSGIPKLIPRLPL